MKKLRLELDTVLVESFETSEVVRERGTVRGHITAALSCRDSQCCTPDPGCQDSNNTGPCQCDPNQFSGALYPTCEYSCMYDACN